MYNSVVPSRRCDKNAASVYVFKNYYCKRHIATSPPQDISTSFKYICPIVCGNVSFTVIGFIKCKHSLYFSLTPCIFAKFCNRCHYQIPEYFYCPRKKTHAHMQPLLTSSTKPRQFLPTGPSVWTHWAFLQRYSGSFRGTWNGKRNLRFWETWVSVPVGHSSLAE